MRQEHSDKNRDKKGNGAWYIKNHGIRKLFFVFGVAVLALVLLFQLQAFPWILNAIKEARISLIRLEFPEKENFLILEIPPSEGGLDASTSQEVFAIIGPTIFSQNVPDIIPTLIDYYRVKYAVFYNTTYAYLFEPFLKRQGDVDALVRIAQIDPKKVSGRTKQPFLSLGEGWYAPEQEEGKFYRWIEQSAAVQAHIPLGKSEEAPTILKFSAKHFPGDGTLGVSLNNAEVAILDVSDAYSDMYVELGNMAEGENSITFNAKDACRLASSKDKRCVSFAFQNIGLMKEDQVPEEGIARYNRFFPAEEDPETGISSMWMSTKADVQIFTLHPQRIFVSFEATSYARARTFVVAVDGEELQTYTVEDGPEFMNMGFPVELQQGNTRIEFIADGCDKPALLEYNEDQRCLSAQIKDFQYQVLQ